MWQEIVVIIIGIVVVLCVIYKLYKTITKPKGKSGCGCGCEGCSMMRECEEKDK